jgi:hypothetical protein
MKNVLIYKIENQLNITHFVDDVDVLTIQRQADNMLPEGTTFRVGTTDELPTSRTFRDAWDVDAADLNDGIAGEGAAVTRVAELTRLVDMLPATDVAGLSAEVAQATTTANTLSAEADTAKQTWEQHKQQAFEAKTTWEAHLSAAEAAELTVTTAGTSATDEQKQQAAELRATADAAWKTQDDLFALKRESQDSVTLATDAAADLEQLTRQLESARIGEQANQDVRDRLVAAQQQLDQLREILPLDARRDRSTENTTETTES